MKKNLFKSCFLAAVVSLFYSCSPDENVVNELESISASEKAMTTDKLSFDNGVTLTSNFVTSATSDGGVNVTISAFQRFYSGANNYSPDNPGVNSTANRANLFNTSMAPISPSDDQDLSDAAQSGNALIINHNSRHEVPDDWAWGGTMNVDFSSLGTVNLSKMVYLDNEEGVVIKLYGSTGNLLHTVTVPARGPAGNSNKEDIVLNTANVAKMEVIQGRDWANGFPPVGSGAIDDIEFMREVPESGCTRTQGYWKTHSIYDGTKKYDATWAKIGEDTPFFSSTTLTYYNIFGVQPRGNSYYSLAHQYVAAKLNMLAGTSAPSSVMTAFNTATSFFTANSPTAVAGSKSLKAEATRLAGILDAYNNGVTGPGHCD